MLPDLATVNSDLAISLEPDTITPDYFVQHYAEFLPRYIAKGNPSADTMKHYCSQIDGFIRWCISKQRHPLSMHEYQMRIYREYLISKQYKNDSMQIMLAAVRAFFITAKKMNLIKENPMKDIAAPTVRPNELVNFYSVEQINEILRVFDNEPDPFIRNRNRLIVYLMAVEGLRNIEVHRACVEDINWEAQAIMIRGKGTRGRLDPIYPSTKTFEILEEYIKSIPISDNQQVKKDGLLTPLILSTSNLNYLGRISRNGIRFVMNQALEACNLKHHGFSCHVLRHSCGTNLYQKTKDLRVVQETLRQRDPKVTARYAHVNERLSHRVTDSIVPE